MAGVISGWLNILRGVMVVGNGRVVMPGGESPGVMSLTHSDSFSAHLKTVLFRIIFERYAGANEKTD